MTHFIKIFKKIVIISSLVVLSLFIENIFKAKVYSASKAKQVQQKEPLFISTETHTLKIVEKSESNKVYLLEIKGNSIPSTEQILLLKKNENNIAAVQVIKTYPDQKRIAAQKIKSYGDDDGLKENQTLTAIEKRYAKRLPAVSAEEPPLAIRTAHKVEFPAIKLFDEDLDSETMAASIKILSVDPELDQKISSENADLLSSSENQEESQTSDEEDIPIGFTTGETKRFDLYRHWLTAGFGYIRNNAPPSSTGGNAGFYYFSSGNIRYGMTIAELLLLNQASVQDSLVLEGGLYTYKTLAYISQSDTYSLIALNLAARYNVFFSENFGIFFYMGVMNNIVTSNSQGQSSGLEALNSTLMAGGGGLFLQLGPNWFTRADLGIDSIGLNLVLRF